MAVQKIHLKLHKSLAINVKNILYKFNPNLPEITITKRLPDNEIEIEFKVPSEIGERAIRKFAASGFTVKPIDAFTKNILFQSANVLKNTYASPGFVLKDKERTGNVNEKQFKELTEYVNSFLEHKKKIPKENQTVLKNSINLYIDKLRKDAYFNKSRAYENIQKLIEIASDKKLKSSTFFEVSKSAGLAAISVSCERSQNIGELINICKNRDVHCLVNAKAAAKFSELVFKDKVAYETEISIAVKKLNSRWLSTVWSTSESDLSEKEIKNFKKLQKFIKGKRDEKK